MLWLSKPHRHPNSRNYGKKQTGHLQAYITQPWKLTQQYIHTLISKYNYHTPFTMAMSCVFSAGYNDSVSTSSHEEASLSVWNIEDKHIGSQQVRDTPHLVNNTPIPSTIHLKQKKFLHFFADQFNRQLTMIVPDVYCSLLGVLSPISTQFVGSLPVASSIYKRQM